MTDVTDRPETSARRVAILRAVATHQARHGRPPSLREIGAVVGITSTSVTHYHLRRMAAEGLVERGRHQAARSWSLTPAGYAALGLVSPAADAALGRALRLAAEGGDETAAELVEALGEVAA